MTYIKGFGKELRTLICAGFRVMAQRGLSLTDTIAVQLSLLRGRIPVLKYEARLRGPMQAREINASWTARNILMQRERGLIALAKSG